MSQKSPPRRLPIVTLALALVTVACTSDAGTNSTTSTGEPTTTSTVAATTTSTTEAPAPSEHRIGVRNGKSGPEFYDKETGEGWVARGFNQWQWELRGGYLMDRTFRAGENALAQAKAELAEMSAHGYNAVRIWFTACFDGAPGCFVEGDEVVRQEYLENVADYLWAAREHGIQVMFTVDDLVGGPYGSGKAKYCCDEWQGFNLHDLTPGGIDDQVAFWSDVVSGLIEVGAPMDTIWAYELRNEQFFESNLPPFGTVDTVTTANGQTYDLTDAEDAAWMQWEGRIFWARTVAAAIKELDPTALVTVGFFSSGQGPAVFGDPDPRLVDPRPFLEVDELDFLDFREYPGFMPGGWDTVWVNARLEQPIDKPIILGEFGAFYSAYDTLEEAITAQTEWLGRACAEGFDGYLGWVWANQSIYDETWDAVSSDGAIATALSPAAIPDPCEPPLPATGNLAYAKPVDASLWEDSDEFYAPPSNAVDGSEGTWWTAPAAGPQWIEIDLLKPSTVDSVVLRTELGADTPLRVVLEFLDAGGALVASEELPAEESPSLVLELVFDTPLQDVRSVRVTTHRDAWIIWHEIEVYGSQ